MPKQERLAAIVNHLSEDELANITWDGALAIMQALRHQPRNAETDAAFKRVALLLLREHPTDFGECSPCVRLLH